MTRARRRSLTRRPQIRSMREGGGRPGPRGSVWGRFPDLNKKALSLPCDPHYPLWKAVADGAPLAWALGRSAARPGVWALPPRTHAWSWACAAELFLHKTLPSGGPLRPPSRWP
jgi:hypothetical protein